MSNIPKSIRNQKIWGKPTTPYSRSAYILLVKKYFYLTKPEWEEWLDFREEYLSHVLKEKGELVCTYCGKRNLKKDAPDYDKMLATIDHIIPLAKGGLKYDLKNLTVACSPCNNNKKDKLNYVPKKLLA